MIANSYTSLLGNENVLILDFDVLWFGCDLSVPQRRNVLERWSSV